MRLPRLVAALALSAALFTAGCEKCFHHQSACCPTAAAAPPCGCSAPAAPYAPAPLVTTPPPGAIIQH